MSNLSVRKMRIFLAAVEEGSFTRASVRENISQPAATIVINEIEETVGTHLFLRRGNVRQAKVTDAGRQVAETFARVVSVYDNETSAIGDISGARARTSRVLLQRGFCDFMSGSWFLSLREALAPHQVCLETLDRGQIVDAIHGREAAIGLIDGLSDDDRCEHMRLGSYKLVLASPVASPKEGIDSWEELPADCVVFGDLNPRLARRLERQVKAAGVNYGNLMMVSSAANIAQIMEAAGHSAIVPDVLVRTLSRACPCIVQDLPGPALEETIGVVAPLGTLARSGLRNILETEQFGNQHAA